ncbi:MAG TPA: hypothetical protein VH593_02565 [Ktedonobacteraceae bacterium]
MRYTFVGHTSPVTVLAWNKESTYIASAGDEGGKVWVWNALQDEQEAGHVGQSGRVLSLAWPGPDATNASPSIDVILSGAEDGTVQVWDAESGKAITTHAERGGIKALLAPFSGGVLLAGDDHIIHYWALIDGNPSPIPVTYQGHTGAINALAEGSGYFASASDDGTVHAWRIPEKVAPTFPS